MNISVIKISFFAGMILNFSSGEAQEKFSIKAGITTSTFEANYYEPLTKNVYPKVYYSQSGQNPYFQIDRYLMITKRGTLSLGLGYNCFSATNNNASRYVIKSMALHYVGASINLKLKFPFKYVTPYLLGSGRVDVLVAKKMGGADNFLFPKIRTIKFIPILGFGTYINLNKKLIPYVEFNYNFDIMNLNEWVGPIYGNQVMGLGLGFLVGVDF